MRSNFYKQIVFTQNIFRTEILRTEGFKHEIFYIEALLYRCVYTEDEVHTETCELVHTAHFLHREVLFPLFDHLPFAFPLSSENSWFNSNVAASSMTGGTTSIVDSWLLRWLPWPVPLWLGGADTVAVVNGEAVSNTQFLTASFF